MRGNVIRFVPACVAAANSILVAATIFANQPGNYPGKLVGVQICIVLASLLIASRNAAIRGVGLVLTLVGVFMTFSAMALYVPTVIAAIWGVVKTRSIDERKCA